VKSVECWAYYFRHHIDLAEYLEQNYGLTFHDSNNQKICNSDPDLVLAITGTNENLWLRSNIPSSQVNEHGIKPRFGNVLTWEAIENNCPIVEAVPIVLKKSKGLQPYRSARLEGIDWISRQTAKRLSIGRTPAVNTYLDNRKIDHALLNTDFKIGAPVPYQQLTAYFSQTKYTSDELKSLLKDIFIMERPAGTRYLLRESSVSVPVYTDQKEFIGFHGRYISSQRTAGKEYFNTGYINDLRSETLYGLHLDPVSQAIAKNKQVIITRGMFELFACYQNGSKQVISTLNQGISSKQFDKVMSLSVNEVIAGFTAPRERQVILGLIHQNLKKVNLSLISADKELDVELGNGSNLSAIMSDCLKRLSADQDAIRVAAIRRRNDNMDTLTEMGGYFLINKADLLGEIAASKRATKKLKTFVGDEFKKATRTLPKGSAFVKMANTLVSSPVLSAFGAELRTLLFLMCKMNPKLGTVTYKHDTLCKDLEISKGVLIKHNKLLVDAGYLLVHKKTSAKTTGPKKKILRSVTFRYYPSSIQ
jgi:hypothetical protein